MFGLKKYRVKPIEVNGHAGRKIVAFVIQYRCFLFWFDYYILENGVFIRKIFVDKEKAENVCNVLDKVGLWR